MDPVSTATGLTLATTGLVTAYGLNAARKESPEAGLHNKIEELQREIDQLKEQKETLRKAKEICEKRAPAAPAPIPPPVTAPAAPSQFAAPGTSDTAAAAAPAPAPAASSQFAAPGTPASAAAPSSPPPVTTPAAPPQFAAPGTSDTAATPAPAPTLATLQFAAPAVTPSNSEQKSPQRTDVPAPFVANPQPQVELTPPMGSPATGLAINKTDEQQEKLANAKKREELTAKVKDLETKLELPENVLPSKQKPIRNEIVKIYDQLKALKGGLRKKKLRTRRGGKQKNVRRTRRS